MAPRKPMGSGGRKQQRGREERGFGNDSKANRGGKPRYSDQASPKRHSHRDDATQGRGQRFGQSGGKAAASGKLNIKTGDDVSILEGRHALEEAVQTGAPIECIYISDRLSAQDSIVRLANEAKHNGVKVRVVEGSALDAYSSHGAHQGVIAQLEPYRYASLKDLVDAAAGKQNALVVATDHVTDAGNFGAIVRSAEVVGASGVLIPNKRNARVNTAAYKTSAGAVLHLPIAMEANLARSLEALKQEGFWIVGASEHAKDIIWDAPLSGRVCLVMGSEGEGLSRLTLEACDLLVKLPQAGKVESLNVAQATTAIAYEWARQSRQQGN